MVVLVCEIGEWGSGPGGLGTVEWPERFGPNQVGHSNCHFAINLTYTATRLAELRLAIGHHTD